MPTKIPLEEIKNRLPSFVKIIESSYKGMRYKAEFIDIEYNEKFKAIPRSVILLKHGCKTRADKKRSEALIGKYIVGKKTPLDEIIKKLPNYISIDPQSYTGVRNKARFYDKEYDVWFESLVCNIIRNGTAMCEERKRANFNKLIPVSFEEAEKRINELYGGKVTLIKESYKNASSMVKVKLKDNNKIYSVNMSNLLLGKSFNHSESKTWRYKVLIRDNFACQICFSKFNCEAHHLNAWASFPKERFDADNGITLCKSCHSKFHSLYGKGDNTKEQFGEWFKAKLPELDFQI